MKWLAAIIDTNVLVSGLLTPNPDAPTRRIVRGMLTARFPFLLSPELVQEYHSVLLRPPIVARHRLARAEVDQLLLRLAQDGIVAEPSVGAAAPDPGDAHVWTLLVVRPDAVLVTGDALLRRRGPRGRIVSARAFAEDLESRGG